MRAGGEQFQPLLICSTEIVESDHGSLRGDRNFISVFSGRSSESWRDQAPSHAASLKLRKWLSDFQMMSRGTLSKTGLSLGEAMQGSAQLI